jgi:TPR repeat protein
MKTTMEHAFNLVCNEEYAAAIPLLTELSNSGNIDALGLLGLCHQFGCGVPRELSLAEVMMQQASDQGHAVSAHNLGTLYASDFATKPNSAVLSSKFYIRAHTLGLVTTGPEFYDYHRSVLRENGMLE